MQKRKREKPKKTSWLSSHLPYIEGMLIGILTFGVLLILTGCMLCLAISALFIASNPSSYDHWAEFLRTPLDKNTIDDLCLIGAIPDLMQVCNQADRKMTFAQINEMMKFYADQNYVYSEFSILFDKYERQSCYHQSNIYRCAYVFGGYRIFLIFNTKTDELIGTG